MRRKDASVSKKESVGLLEMGDGSDFF